MDLKYCFSSKKNKESRLLDDMLNKLKPLARPWYPTMISGRILRKPIRLSTPMTYNVSVKTRARRPSHLVYNKVSNMSSKTPIPGFSNYVMTRNGDIINSRTGYTLSDKDSDHRSGRVSLYSTKGRKVTFNRANLYQKTFGKVAPRKLGWD